MELVVNNVVANAYSVLSGCIEIIVNPVIVSFNAIQETSTISNEHNLPSTNLAPIDYDTVDILHDLSLKNEDRIECTLNNALGLLTINSASDTVSLYNKNGIELKVLQNGENDMNDFPIGLYYLATKYGNRITALTSFYCVK